MSKALELFRRIQSADIALTDKILAPTPFHASFWVANRLNNAIISHADLGRGVMLDIGCGLKPYEKYFAPFTEKYFGLEYSLGSGYRGNRADLCGDAQKLPLKSESLDTILCTEVLEHVPDPEAMIAEFARTLKPGGVVITTAPFFFPVHDEWDFYRYSPKGIPAIMERSGLTVEKVMPLSGGGVTVAILLNLYIFDLGFMWTKWLYPVGLLLRPLLWILIFFINMTGWLMEKIVPAPQMSFNHLTIGRKVSTAGTENLSAPE